MSLITVDKTQITAPNWTRIQESMFPLLISGTITQASEVTEISVSDYMNKNVLDQVVCDYEESAHNNQFSFLSPTE